MANFIELSSITREVYRSEKINEYARYQHFGKKTQIKGIGVDIASISKITRLINLSDHLLDRGLQPDCETLALVFTPQEQNYCQSVSNSHVSYALCFAIKEAVGKALGTGLVGIDWSEIEADLTQKKPIVRLSGRAETKAQKLGIKQWLVDWWEWQDCVLVNVLAFS